MNSRHEILNEILELEDPKEIEILSEHYLFGEKFVTVADDLCITPSHAAKIAGNALTHFYERYAAEIEINRAEE